MHHWVLPSVASEKHLTLTHSDGNVAAIRIASPSDSLTIMVSRQALIEMLREATGLTTEEKETAK